MSSLENCLPAALLSIELFCGMLEILAPFLSLWEYNNEHAERYQQENIICESLIYFLFFSNQQKLQNIVRAVYSHSDFFLNHAHYTSVGCSLVLLNRTLVLMVLIISIDKIK